MRACTDTCFQPFHQLPLLNASLLYWGNWRNYGIWNWYGEKGGLSPLRIVLAGARFSISTRNFRRSRHLLQNFTRCITLDCWGVIGTTWSQLKVIIPVISISIFIAILLAKN